MVQRRLIKEYSFSWLLRASSSGVFGSAAGGFGRAEQSMVFG